MMDQALAALALVIADLRLRLDHVAGQAESAAAELEAARAEASDLRQQLRALNDG